MTQTQIPAHLGECKVIKEHDDGDLTVKCGEDFYMVTPGGEVFRRQPVPSEVAITELKDKIKRFFGEDVARKVVDQAVSSCSMLDILDLSNLVYRFQSREKQEESDRIDSLMDSALLHCECKKK